MSIDDPPHQSSGEDQSTSECPNCSRPVRVEASRGARKPSPAFVLSLIALFVSLAGGAYAAFTLPANSVGTKQIKNGAVTGSKLARETAAPNALRLAGAQASAYQRACRSGAVAAHVYVKGSDSFSSQYTKTGRLQDKFNCTGGVVEVKRVSTGVYVVHFGGLGVTQTGPNLIAVGNQSVDALAKPVLGGSLSFQLIQDPSRGGAIVYQVTLTGAAAARVDNEFSFALLSPQ
jgi:hypothetical protein